MLACGGPRGLYELRRVVNCGERGEICHRHGLDVRSSQCGLSVRSSIDTLSYHQVNTTYIILMSSTDLSGQ